MAKRRTTIIIEEEIGLENTKSVFVNEEKATEVKKTKTKKSNSKSKSKTTKTKSSKANTKSTTSKTKSSSKKGTSKKTSSKKSSKKTSSTKNKEAKDNTSLEQVETKENLEETSNLVKELPSPLQEETSKETKNELTIKEEDKLTPSLLDNEKDNKETITDPEIIDPIKEDIDNKEDKDNKDKEDLDVIDATIIEKDNRDIDINKVIKEDSSKANLPKEKGDKSNDIEEKNLPSNKEDDLDKAKEQKDKNTTLPEIKKEDFGTSKDEDNKEEKEVKTDKKAKTENTIIVPETVPTKEEISTEPVTQPLPSTSSESQEKDDKQDSKKLPLSVKLNPLSLIKLFSKSKYKGVIIGTTILVILVAILVPISINLLNKDPYKEINEEDINKETFITKDEFFNEVTSFDLKLATSKYNDVTSDGYLLSSFNKVNDIYSFSYESRFDDIAETSVKGGPIVYKIEITLDEETNKYKINNYEDSTLVNTSSLSESEAISYIKEYVNLFYDAYLIYDSEYLKGIIKEGKESNSSPKYFINEETSEIKLSSSPSDVYEFNYDQNGIIKDGIYATSIKESKDNPNSEINKIYSQLEFKYTLNS